MFVVVVADHIMRGIRYTKIMLVILPLIIVTLIISMAEILLQLL
jgi:hypothetical protein